MVKLLAGAARHSSRYNPRMSAATPAYFFARTLDVPFETVIERATAALAAEGFGVLTEIDVQAKLAEKLGVEMPRYRILGACNPPLAHQAIGIEARIGLLMPCNIVVREVEGGVEVSIGDPAVLLVPTGRSELQALAADARARLERALAAL